jgi:hypothetical protein
MLTVEDGVFGTAATTADVIEGLGALQGAL